MAAADSAQTETATGALRVLVANERRDRLAEIARLLVEIGHDVVAETVDVEGAGMLTRTEDPDVAFVAVGGDRHHALEQVESIAEEASCPVVVVVEEKDPAFVAQAAARGAFACAADTSPEDLQSSVEIALRRFAELQDVREAGRRRALVERAKGILMERHGESEREAFERLRWHARKRQERIVTVAQSMLAAHELLPARTDVASAQAETPRQLAEREATPPG